MTLSRLIPLVLQNIARNKKNFVFSSVGILVGVTLFSFFLALAGGIRERVLNRVYPINQVEIEPMSVSLAGFKRDVRNEGRLDEAAVRDLATIPGVTHVFPKQRSKLPSMFKGGAAIFGHDRFFEAFFDGLAAELLWDELKENEQVVEKRRRFEGRRVIPCGGDEDCKPGFECLDEGCRPIEYWRHFRYGGQLLPCERDDQCLEGELCAARRCERVCGDDTDCGDGRTCGAKVMGGACAGSADCPEQGHCRDGRCEVAVCMTSCRFDADCPLGSGCVPEGCTSAADCLGAGCDGGHCTWAGYCRPLPCRLATARDQEKDACDKVRGEVLRGRDASGLPCPDGTYCAVDSYTGTTGTCERPVPALLSPFLIEMYNAVAGPQMGGPRIEGTEMMLGLEMRMVHGQSLITRDVPPPRERILRRVRLVGFSDKALDLGVTVPLEYVRRMNAHFRGLEEARRYDTVILQTAGNEYVSGVTLAAEERGFTLSRKSEDARKAGTMLFVLTLVFGFISVVILVIAAVNITHTFLMIISERKHEIGILRAIGAGRTDIRLLILVEAGLIGLFGGVLGNLCALGLSAVANSTAARYLGDIPFRPDDLFLFSPAIICGSVGFALLFCLLGAFLPANRAAGMDPARVLSSP